MYKKLLKLAGTKTKILIEKQAKGVRREKGPHTELPFLICQTGRKYQVLLSTPCGHRHTLASYWEWERTLVQASYRQPG